MICKEKNEPEHKSVCDLKQKLALGNNMKHMLSLNIWYIVSIKNHTGPIKPPIL